MVEAVGMVAVADMAVEAGTVAAVDMAVEVGTVAAVGAAVVMAVALDGGAWGWVWGWAGMPHILAILISTILIHILILFLCTNSQIRSLYNLLPPKCPHRYGITALRQEVITHIYQVARKRGNRFLLYLRRRRRAKLPCRTVGGNMAMSRVLLITLLAIAVTGCAPTSSTAILMRKPL
jgi:hypothetical protein